MRDLCFQLSFCLCCRGIFSPRLAVSELFLSYRTSGDISFRSNLACSLALCPVRKSGWHGSLICHLKLAISVHQAEPCLLLKVVMKLGSCSANVSVNTF